MLLTRFALLRQMSGAQVASFLTEIIEIGAAGREQGPQVTRPLVHMIVSGHRL